jgi:hypothetical protein
MADIAEKNKKKVLARKPFHIGHFGKMLAKMAYITAKKISKALDISFFVC